jgi:hypothetical protein
MNVRIFGFFACVAAMLFVGCSSSGDVVRGQSPLGAGTELAMSTLAGAHGDTSHAGSGCQLCHEQGSPCHECNRKSRLGRITRKFTDRRCSPRTEAGRKHLPKDHPGADWKPTHKHFYTYDQPKNLVYPKKNTPPAVVQYPYYTAKGPTDFFYK